MTRLSPLLPLAGVLAVVLPATAMATTPPVSTPTPPVTSTPTPPSTTTPPPTTPAGPAGGTLTTRLERVGGRLATVLVGERVRVRGVVSQYVAGQHVVVRFYLGSKRVRSRRVAIQPTKGGRGTFLLGYAPHAAGRMVVRAAHAATSAQLTMTASPKGFDVLPRRVGAGSSSAAIRMLQRRLTATGYVVGARGRYDDRTARAVLAFRKVTGLARTTDASEDVMRRLALGGGHFRVRFPRQGHHVEADLSLQVLALIDHGEVQRIYPISSGKPSTPTVLGSYRVYMKTPGTNAHGMVFSSFFIRGYAIHGYVDVPAYAASHGCLRVPIPDAVPIYDWVKMGDWVDVYP